MASHSTYFSRTSISDEARGQHRDKLAVDFSLGLLNRTGAYFLSKDLIVGLRSYFSDVYCWRLPNGYFPDGIPRKLLARMMMREHSMLRDAPFLRVPRRSGATLYLDPLFVLRSDLGTADVVLCHDVGPLTHSALFDPATVSLYKAAYDKLRNIGPGMVFVSEFSKREFCRLFGDRFRFMRVIPLYPRRDIAVGAPQPVAGISRPFLLAVGALEQRKNYERCIEAFARTPLRDTHQLVICGPRGNAARSIRAAVASQPSVRLLGAVHDTELSWLYRNALGFVLPSLLEGFCLPVVEAVEQGLVCVASRSGAQEEALGGHGIFVDPLQVESIAEGMMQLVAMTMSERQICVASARAHTASLTVERFIGGWRALLDEQRGVCPT